MIKSYFAIAEEAKKENELLIELLNNTCNKIIEQENTIEKQDAENINILDKYSMLELQYKDLQYEYNQIALFPTDREIRNRLHDLNLECKNIENNRGLNL